MTDSESSEDLSPEDREYNRLVQLVLSKMWDCLDSDCDGIDCEHSKDKDWLELQKWFKADEKQQNCTDQSK